MPSPRIFISHAAADDPTLLWAVHDALKAAGFDVLMDVARLQGGMDWRNEIYVWIARAHGAVVILTEKSKDRDWVKFEIAALASRRLLDGVQLIPVLVPPLDDAVLRERQFEPYDVARLQAMKVDSTDANAIDDVVSRFQGLVQAFSDTPFDLLQMIVARALKVDDDVLERTALALDPAAQNAIVDKSYVAAALFHAPADKLCNALQQLGGDMSRSQLLKILQIVTPFWIEPAAIVDIAREAASPGGPHRILLLNTTNGQIGVMYIQRAALAYPLKWSVIPVNADAGENPIAGVQADMRKWFRNANLMLAVTSDADVDAHIRSRPSPVIIVLPHWLKLERIAELRDLYPNCIFISLAGKGLPDDATLKTVNAVVIEPRLDAARESAITMQYGECSTVVNNTAE